MNTTYKIFKWLKAFSDKKMRENYLKPHGGCDSCCPNCREWESQGNLIATPPLEDGSDSRICGKCHHEWLTIFTPAGFAPLSAALKPKQEIPK
jgi:hypothetical protein